MMIVVAFGAALLGVLILHKLRERRIYSLIVKQKDRDFYSLHLLLQAILLFFSLLHANHYVSLSPCHHTPRVHQYCPFSYFSDNLFHCNASFLVIKRFHCYTRIRNNNLIHMGTQNLLIWVLSLLSPQKEREYYQEVKRKNDEMKAKIYTLRTQKMELDRRVLELQSTIDSLKDELKTMEVAFEEKQNEIKELRAQQDDQMGKNERETNGPQVVALVESMKQKEAEIAGLKRRLELPEKVWSVSSDDRSGSSPPVNVTASDVEKIRVDQGENGNGDKRGMMGQRGEKFENVKDQSVKDDGVLSDGGDENEKNEDAKDNKVNSTRVISHNGGKNIDDGDGGSKARANGQLEKHEDLRDEGEENRETAKDAMKSEVLRDVGANGVWSAARGKRVYISNTKEKRWRLIAKSRRLENNGRSNGVASKTSMRFYEDGRDGLKNRVKKATFNKQVPLVSDGNNQLEGRKAESYTDNSLKSGSFENKVASYSVVKALDQKAENGDAISTRRDVSRKEMSKNMKYNNMGSEDLKATDVQDSEKSASNLDENDAEYKDEIEG